MQLSHEAFLTRILRLSKRPAELQRFCVNFRPDLSEMCAVAREKLHYLFQHAAVAKPDEVIEALAKQHRRYALRVEQGGTTGDVEQSRRALPQSGKQVWEAHVQLRRYQMEVSALVHFISVAESMHDGSIAPSKNYMRIIDGILIAIGGWRIAPSIYSKPRYRVFDPTALEVFLRQLDVTQAVKDPAFWKAFDALSSQERTTINRAVRTKQNVALERIRASKNPNRDE